MSHVWLVFTKISLLEGGVTGRGRVWYILHLLTYSLNAHNVWAGPGQTQSPTLHVWLCHGQRGLKTWIVYRLARHFSRVQDQSAAAKPALTGNAASTGDGPQATRNAGHMSDRVRLPHSYFQVKTSNVKMKTHVTE